jgi:hypothetical protein
MHLERPLASLPVHEASRLVADLFGDPRGRADLGEAMVVGREINGRFAPLGIYALAPLCGHPLARRLTAAIGGPIDGCYAGPFGIVHVLAGRAGCGAEAALLTRIAHRALACLYGAVFFCGVERAGPYQRLGVEFPGMLATVGPAMGVLEPGQPASLAILRALDQGLDLAA